MFIRKCVRPFRHVTMTESHTPIATMGQITWSRIAMVAHCMSHFHTRIAPMGQLHHWGLLRWSTAETLRFQGDGDMITVQGTPWRREGLTYSTDEILELDLTLLPNSGKRLLSNSNNFRMCRVIIIHTGDLVNDEMKVKARGLHFWNLISYNVRVSHSDCRHNYTIENCNGGALHKP